MKCIFFGNPVETQKWIKYSFNFELLADYLYILQCGTQRYKHLNVFCSSMKHSGNNSYLGNLQEYFTYLYFMDEIFFINFSKKQTKFFKVKEFNFLLRSSSIRNLCTYVCCWFMCTFSNKMQKTPVLLDTSIPCGIWITNKKFDPTIIFLVKNRCILTTLWSRKSIFLGSNELIFIK